MGYERCVLSATNSDLDAFAAVEAISGWNPSSPSVPNAKHWMGDRSDADECSVLASDECAIVPWRLGAGVSYW